MVSAIQQIVKADEIWRPLVGFKISLRYEVSNYGQLASLDYWHKEGRRKIRPLQTSKKGYLRTTIQGRVIQMHRAVALAFIPNPCGYDQVNHKDGNKKNNHVDNLEWCNSKINVQHSLKTGIANRAKGERCRTAYLNEQSIRKIRSEYKPHVRGLRDSLAKKYGTTAGNIKTIIAGKSWRHVL